MITRKKRGGGGFLALLLRVTLSSATVPLAFSRTPAHSEPVVMTIEAAAGFEIETGTESPLPIRIAPEAATPAKALILIRGLPPSVALTEGRLFDSGVWAVRATDLPRLRVAAPAQAVKKRELSFSLVTFDGMVLANAVSTFAVVPANTAGRRPPATASPTPDFATAATPDGQREPTSSAHKPSLTLEDIEHAQLYMRKGEENMHAGNIIVARLFFARAANAGWAPGAFALARTYDPVELRRLAVTGGINPDMALARKWYEKADELGAIEARDRLRRLGNP